MQVDLELVEELLHTEAKLERDKVLAIVNALKKAKQEEDDAKPEPIKPPKFDPMILFIKGPCPEESVALIVEFDREIPHTMVLDKLLTAVREANVNSKKKHVFGKLSEVIESMPRKWLKGTGIKIRHKQPAIIKEVDNEIPGVEQARNEEDDLQEVERTVGDVGEFVSRLETTLVEAGATMVVTRGTGESGAGVSGERRSFERMKRLSADDDLESDQN